MFKIRTFLLFILFLIPINVFAFDGQVFMRDTVKQGDSIEVRIPANEYSEVNATFGGNQVKFFEVNEEARWDEAISRGAFLKAVFDNMEDKPAIIIDNLYIDVTEENKYYEEIMLGTQLGIVRGNFGYDENGVVDYTKRSFLPYKSISRAEAAKILFNMFHLSPAGSSDQLNFGDLNEEHPLYFYMLACNKEGIFRGYDDGLIRPDNPINYLETEIILKRILDKDEIVLDKENRYFRGYAGANRNWGTGTYYLDFDFTKKIVSEVENIEKEIIETLVTEDYSVPVDVQYTNFAVQWFNMPQSNMSMTGNGASDRTWARVYEVIAETNPQKYFSEQFMIPTNDDYITLGWGDKLYINGVASGSHFGYDYANPEGTPIYVSNTGKIVMAEWTDFFGNTVMIDRGENIFTMYLHLSELNCEAGQEVNKGDLIGLMGTTGFSTGSHLHFSIMVGDVFVNPDQFFEMMF